MPRSPDTSTGERGAGARIASGGLVAVAEGEAAIGMTGAHRGQPPPRSGFRE